MWKIWSKKVQYLFFHMGRNGRKIKFAVMKCQLLLLNVNLVLNIRYITKGLVACYLLSITHWQYRKKIYMTLLFSSLIDISLLIFSLLKSTNTALSSFHFLMCTLRKQSKIFGGLVVLDGQGSYLFLWIFAFLYSFCWKSSFQFLKI